MASGSPFIPPSPRTESGTTYSVGGRTQVTHWPVSGSYRLGDRVKRRGRVTGSGGS